MRNQLSFKTAGWKVSAVLAVPYVLVMLASLILVGKLSTGSWQAAFLGIEWSTIVGFEVGLIGVVVACFTVSGVFVSILDGIQQIRSGQAKYTTRPGSSVPLTSSWPVRFLIACFILPASALLVLRLFATSASITASQGTGEAAPPVHGVGMQPVNLGLDINSAYREAEPTFTSDGQTMYFNCNNGDICVSKRVIEWREGKWTKPERLGVPINTGFEEVEPIISGDGNKLYFTSIRPAGILARLSFLSPFMNVVRVANTLANTRLGRTFFGGLGLPDVYLSYRTGGEWSEPVRLSKAAGEPPVNTAFGDHCLFFSADGNEAFWTSTRPGGFGGNDIWTSRRVNGRWTAAENLGPNVNGPGDEHTSIPTPDGLSLYVTATRPEGFGGEDIYVTTRSEGGKWGLLSNLGSLVNGPGDDRCPAWTPDQKVFLFDSVREGGLGARDIWWVYFEDVTGFPHANAHTSSAISVSGSHAPESFVP